MESLINNQHRQKSGLSGLRGELNKPIPRRNVITDGIGWFIMFHRVQALDFMRGMDTKQFDCLEERRSQ